MQSEWPYIRIGELVAAGDAILQTGPFGSQLHKHDYVERGVAIIPTEAIGRGAIRAGVTLPQISEAKAAELGRHKLRQGDILFARRGVQATGLSAVIGPEHVGAICGTGAILLRVNQEVLNPYFLAAALATDAAHEWLRAHAVGAVMPNLNSGIISQLAVPKPDLAEQRGVASMTQALARRIDLLRQTNATLESIAQALFKSWFIDFDPVRAKAEGREPEGMDALTATLFPAEFEETALGLIPKGWGVGTLGSVCTNPKTQAKPGQMPADTMYIGLEHMPRKSIALDNAGTAEGLESGKFWFERNDVLFGKLRPYFHKVGLAPCRGVCSTDILVLRPKAAEWLGFLTMHASSDALIAHTTQLSNGARMPRTSWHDVSGFDVVLPSQNVAEAFNVAIIPMFERIHSNIEAARVLAELRDLLLPRLISGKLRVPEAQAQLEEAIP